MVAQGKGGGGGKSQEETQVVPSHLEAWAFWEVTLSVAQCQLLTGQLPGTQPLAAARDEGKGKGDSARCQ